MRFRVKANPSLKLFTLKQLQEIADNLVVEENCGVVRTSFSTLPPADTTRPWQPTDECSFPIGRLKYFKNGEWK